VGVNRQKNSYRRFGDRVPGTGAKDTVSQAGSAGEEFSVDNLVAWVGKKNKPQGFANCATPCATGGNR